LINLPLDLTSGIELTPEQTELTTAPLEGSTILTGQAETGKSTAGALRLKNLVQQGIPGDSILVLVPQRSLASQYYSQVQSPGFPSSSMPSIQTFGGLAQRMVSLFWPLIARESGFKNPNKPCRFLTLETAQYFLATLVEPLLQQGYFDSLTIDPNRLYSQILDNLNKSAVVGFDPSEISDRLIRAWAGNPSQSIIYQQGQECALLFRDFCYQNNLLDFSLQLSVFTKYLWPSLICRQYLERTFQHLIYDNIEEDIPVAHDVVADWLPAFKSALLIQDSDSGFRTFLGADPSSSNRFLNFCSTQVTFVESFVKTPALSAFETTLDESIFTHKLSSAYLRDYETPFSIHPFRFYPEAMDWVKEEISQLIVKKNITPSDIAILTPFLSDSLRFSFTSRLSEADIPFTTYRPSRSLRDEPAVRTMLTLAKLANPGWGIAPTQQDVRNALIGSIDGCDLIRADLLSKMMFNAADASTPLRSFDPVKPDMQTRITFSVGEKYEKLRIWLLENTNQGSDILDHWISRLFGELLSQPGYRFHADFDSANAIARLIESCRKFRQVLLPANMFSSSGSGKEYIRVLEQGILAAQSLSTWNEQTRSDAVFLSPAFSFLMTNRPVKYQFWIDIGSQGWWSRLDQPLTQPFVLNRNWTSGKMWTDAEEYLNNQKTLARITTGLIRRCSQHIYMCTLGHNEQGLEERGALVMAMQTILRQINLDQEHGNV
jgi:hypothetical protein